MQLFTQGGQGDFQVFDDRVALILIVEGLFVRAGNRMLGEVIHPADAGGLALIDQPFAATGDQHGLHEAPRLAQIEKVAGLLLAPHLDDAALLVVAGVGQGPQRDIHAGVLLLRRRHDDGLGQGDDLVCRRGLARFAC